MEIFVYKINLKKKDSENSRSLSTHPCTHVSHSYDCKYKRRRFLCKNLSNSEMKNNFIRLIRIFVSIKLQLNTQTYTHLNELFSTIELYLYYWVRHLTFYFN